ncbi:winged helix-turn-helix transcriptional regulator [Streptomyces melanogenes]|uniref:winged helix-turn-helix transcriptional regulator n=1 Tax=Streptomyces melanogenes TaxID=67326 RepID=UPI00167EB143|nr:winged helix-turn-helix transcriptional regulator [Streptomyces melanogenes]GGP92508.1 HxlR family transcriptional regulator [Streptomyces melanogenes]
MIHGSPTPLPAGGRNATSVAFGLVCDSGTLSVLDQALRAAHPQGARHEAAPLADAALGARLARLWAHGLLSRQPHPDERLRYAYRPTRRGESLRPFLVALEAWESRWGAGRPDPPLTSFCACRPCGEPTLVCRACEQSTASSHEVRSVIGPSGGGWRSIPPPPPRLRGAPPPLTRYGHFPEAVKVIGDRWSAVLVGAAFLGPGRLEQFQQCLGNPSALSTDRLRALRALGILEREGSSWTLTVKGRALFPALMLLVDWGQRWYEAPEGPALLSVHRSCGQPFAPRLVCGTCGGNPAQQASTTEGSDLSALAAPHRLTAAGAMRN